MTRPAGSALQRDLLTHPTHSYCWDSSPVDMQCPVELPPPHGRDAQEGCLGAHQGLCSLPAAVESEGQASRPPGQKAGLC